MKFTRSKCGCGGNNQGQSSLEFLYLTALLFGLLHVPLIKPASGDRLSIWQWLQALLTQGYDVHLWLLQHAFLLPGAVL